MKNIAFIANHSKTYFFLELSKYLLGNNIVENIFWFSSSEEITLSLIEKGVSSENILDCSVKNYDEYRTHHFEPKKLIALEKCLPMTILNLIRMDRNLRHKKIDFAKWYIDFLFQETAQFIKTNNIDVIFGEQTWAFECVIFAVAESLNKKALAMHTVRYPSNRFAFFSGSLQNKIVMKNNSTNNQTESLFDAERWLADFQENNDKPFYFYGNNKVPKFEFAWIKKLKRHLLMPKNEAGVALSQLVKIKCKSAVNAKILKKMIKNWKSDISDISDDFVLITLHKQPEASIDLLDIYNSDQLTMIKEISYALPVNMKLYVKEHSNAIGDRGYFWYKEVENLPNVELVSPYLDSKMLIKLSKLVISVSGTSCLEAGLLGKAAICTANMFFSPILVKSGCSTKDIAELLHRNSDVFEGATIGDRVDYINTIYRSTYKGIISDPISTPSCIDPENIKDVCIAINEIIN